MKRRIVSLFCMLALTFSLCCGISAVSDNSIVLTSVNDSLLSLSAGTMPVQRSGGWYVPYTVFADGSAVPSSLGLIAAYNTSQQTMLVYDREGRSLNFQISVGFVTDENGTYYSQPALPINGTVYLPVKTICNKFDLSYSYISKTYNYLRIVSSAKMSDSLFASAARELAEKMVNTYKSQLQSSSSGETNSQQPASVPVTPPSSDNTDDSEEEPEEADKNPSSLTLFICGYPGVAASSMVDALNQAGLKGNFFVDGSAILTEDEHIRKMLAGGHTIGIRVPESALTDSQTLTDYLAQANEDLFLAAGITTRLCHIAGGSAGKLTANQLAALSACGYRLWDDTAAPSGSSSQALTKSALRLIHASENRCILNLGMTQTASQALKTILEDIQTNRIPTLALAESDTPVNDYDYTK